MFNGHEWNGRQLSVREDKNAGMNRQNNYQRNDQPRQERSGNEQRERSEKHQLFVGNLPWSVTWQDLKDLAKHNDLNPIRADVTIGYV